MEVPGLDAYEDMAVRCLVGEYKYSKTWLNDADKADSKARVVVVDRLYALPVRPVLIIVLSEGLFDQTAHDGVLSGMGSHGWIVEKYLHTKNGNRRPVEEEVLDQLSRRGVQVVQMSADSDTISRLPSDAPGRSRLVIEKGLSMLQNNNAFVHLSLAADLQYTEFRGMLDSLEYLTREAVVAITAISIEGCTKTVFDAVFQRASV